MQVTMQDLQEAALAATVAPASCFLESCRTYECCFIAAMALELRHQAKDEVQVFDILFRMKMLCQTQGIPCPGTSLRSWRLNENATAEATGKSSSSSDPMGFHHMIQLCRTLLTVSIVALGSCQSKDLSRDSRLRLNISTLSIWSAFRKHALGRKLIPMDYQ